MTGKLISLEGIECSGKGTQAKLLRDYLLQAGISVQLMHEPGGSYYGEALRAILKYPERALGAIYRELAGHADFPLFKSFAAISVAGHLDVKRTPLCELFLYEAARAEYAAIIRQILKDGDSVISDRLHDSTIAYQGGGRGVAKPNINMVNRLALEDVWPDLTFFLDIPVAVMLERMSREDDEKNAFFEKTCDQAFFERVRKSYRDISLYEPKRFIIINGDQPIESVTKQIQTHIDELFGLSCR